MYTDFREAHDGPILSRSEKITVESDCIILSLRRVA